MAKRQHDIERYLRGEMTPSEMHALEKEALNDPFLAEALEGINQSDAESFLFDLNELNHTVHQRTRQHKPKFISMWNWSLGIAAGLILVAISGVYVIYLIGQRQEASSLSMLAKPEATELKPSEKNLAPPATDSSDTTSRKTTSDNRLALNEPAPEQKPKASNPDRPHALADEASKKQQPVVAPAGESLEQEQAQERLLADEDQRLKAAPQTEALARDAAQGAVTREEAVRSATREKEAKASAMKRDHAAPTRIVKGKVTSAEDGSALPGVNVLVKGTNIGAITNEEGNYEIALNDTNQKLLFAFMGLQNQEVDVTGKEILNVTMTPDYSQLSEVVVSGYSADDSEKKPPVLELAEPEGGRKAFQKYLEEKMSYPAQAVQNNVEGRVTVQFTVAPNGELRDFKIIKGIGFGCDDEVIRLIKEGPAWTPTKRDTQPVGDKVKVRLRFNLPN